LNVPRTQEQVWARHILVETKDQAEEVLALLQDGSDFATLAGIYSTDSSNSQIGGDLGWFGKGAMVAPFEEVAFALEPGEISEIVETDFGFHIIQSLGKEERPLSDTEYQDEKSAKFEEWMTSQRDAATIVTREDWNTRTPSDPVLPQEITDYIAQLAAQLNPPQPTEAIPTVQP
jgi:parvulin-like peptidyl-prolyl isomerase